MLIVAAQFETGVKAVVETAEDTSCQAGSAAAAHELSLSVAGQVSDETAHLQRQIDRFLHQLRTVQ